MQTLRWVHRPLRFSEDCRRRFGPRFTMRLIAQSPMVSVSDPDDIRAVFTAPADVLHPGAGARILDYIVGRHSVLLLDEGEHLRQRRLMLPAFHGERMAALAGLVADVTEREVARWPRGEEIALHPRLQALTLEIILRAVFGLDPGPRMDRLRALLTEALDLGAQPAMLVAPLRRDLGPLTGWRRFHRVRDQVHTELRGLIGERREETERDDVLAMLLAARDEHGEPMTDEEVRDELMTLLVAGHETTASELAWAFDAIARTPGVLDGLRSGDEAYRDAVVAETLRRRPVLPIAQPRMVHKPWALPGGEELPLGVAVCASIGLLHHDPELYPDPYAFRPERFLERTYGTYEWIPFGGGVRRCLGASFAQLEMRTVLAEVARSAPPQAVTAPTEGAVRRSITLSPRRGARLVLAAA